MAKKILSVAFKRQCAEFIINHGYKHCDAAKGMDISLHLNKLYKSTNTSTGNSRVTV